MSGEVVQVKVSQNKAIAFWIVLAGASASVKIMRYKSSMTNDDDTSDFPHF